jgi:hypothetical protein
MPNKIPCCSQVAQRLPGIGLNKYSYNFTDRKLFIIADLMNNFRQQKNLGNYA